MSVSGVFRDGNFFALAQSVFGALDFNGILAAEDFDDLFLVWMEVLVRIVEEEALVIQFDVACPGVHPRMERAFESDEFSVRVRRSFHYLERLVIRDVLSLAAHDPLIRRVSLRDVSPFPPFIPTLPH